MAIGCIAKLTVGTTLGCLPHNKSCILRNAVFTGKEDGVVSESAWLKPARKEEFCSHWSRWACFHLVSFPGSAPQLWSRSQAPLPSFSLVPRLHSPALVSFPGSTPQLWSRSQAPLPSFGLVPRLQKSWGVEPESEVRFYSCGLLLTQPRLL